MIKPSKVHINRVCSVLVVLILTVGYGASKVPEHVNSSTHTTTSVSPGNSSSTSAATSFVNDIAIETVTDDQKSVEVPQSEQFSKKSQEFKQYKCGQSICISKCCQNGFLKEVYGGCVKVAKYNANNWTPDDRTVDILQAKIVQWIPILPKTEKYHNYICPMYESHEFAFQDDGTVYVHQVDQYIPPEMYCIDNMYDEDKNKTAVAGFFCLEKIVKTPFEKIMDKVLTGALTVSAVFLLCILVLNLLSPERKDLQAKCIISSCFSLFFGFLAIVVNSTDLLKDIDPVNCVALAIGAQFFMLSFYFWLNVMCFEVLRITRGTMKSLTYKEMTKSERRYFGYCAYAWGSPLFISLITIMMQYIPYNTFPEIEKYLIRPEIGEGRCWFKESGGAIYVYYYAIEIFLHIGNASLMGYATYLLYKEEGMCFCCKNNPPMRLWTYNAKKRLDMFKRQLCIFIMFVFIWILNSISLINPRSYFWRTIDVVVALQGVFLFLIVIKPKKYAMLRMVADRMCSMAKGVSGRIGSKKALVPSVLETSIAPETESNL